MSGTKAIRGIRQSIASGYVLGRTAPGVGAVGPVHMSNLAQQLAATGTFVTQGGASPEEWTAGDVGALGAGLTINSGTLTVTFPAQEWTAGDVGALGAGLTINSGTLTVTFPAQEWTAGNVTAIGPTLMLALGTLNAVNLASHIWAPTVNGDLPGPTLISSPRGECVMVPIT